MLDLLDELVGEMKRLFAEVDGGEGEGEGEGNGNKGNGRDWMDCGTSVGVLVVKKKMK